MASAKPELTRDGTMQVTAKEGIGYLQAAGKDTLLEMQGLKPSEEDSAKDTADKDTDHGDNKPDPDSKTSVDQKKKPKMAKGITMQATAKEGKAMMGDSAPDQDALTRGQQKKIEDIQNEAASAAKKPRMTKNTTMVNTAKEGKAMLEDEKLGDTRAETKAKEKPAAPKRDSTIKATVREAQYLLQSGTVDVNEGRRTRSQARGDAPKPAAMKKAGTMQSTAKEGKEFLQRGKKGKGKKDLDAVAEKEDEAEEEEKNKDAEEEAEKDDVKVEAEKEVTKKDAKKGRARGKKAVEAAKEEDKEEESTENA